MGGPRRASRHGGEDNGAGSSRPGRRTARRAPRRRAAIAAMLIGVMLTVFVWNTAPAAASYPQIRAEVGCDRVVRWSAQAAPSDDPAERTNLSVEVSRLVNGGEWEPVGPTVAFDESNGFSAAGSFELDEGADSVRLRARALADWGPDGSAGPPGAPRHATARVPAGCDEVPVGVAHEMDCAASAVDLTVRPRPDGSAPLTEGPPGEEPLVVRLDGVVVRSLRAGETRLTVPVAPGAGSRLQVEWSDIDLLDVSVGADCDDSAPRAVIIERCGPHNAVLAVAAPAGTGVELRIGERLALREDVPAPDRLLHYFALPDDATPVDVRVDGQTLSTGVIGGCDGPVAGAVSCGPGSGPCAGVPRPDVGDESGTPNGTATERPALDDAEGSLARTGPWERALLAMVAAALFVGGGATLYTAERVGAEKRSLAGAIAPYRQTWWNDSGTGPPTPVWRRWFRFVRPGSRR